MSFNTDNIIDFYQTHLGLKIPDNNLYDGNYETVYFQGDELMEMVDSVEVDPNKDYLTHQYLKDDTNVYTLITNETNDRLLGALELNMMDGEVLQFKTMEE